jgi:hypothetical protein
MTEMPERDTFDRLSSNLDQDDKIRLLEQIRSQTDMSERQLIDVESAPPENNENLYAQLSWFRKILYMIMGFFTGKTAKDIFVNSLTQEAGRAIEQEYPGMYDHAQSLLRASLQDELKRLKEAARFFYAALDSSVNKDAGAFFVFLGAAEMADLHKKIMEGSDPAMYAVDHPDWSFSKLKRAAVNYIESVIAGISDDQRNAMYQNARSLLCLKQLASFLYDRLILSFNKHGQDEGPVCPVSLVKSQLVQLNNILFSLKTTPSITLMSSIFVFIMQEHKGEDGYDETGEMQKFTTRAEKALETIRAFNRRVPLTRILRCASRDMSLQPSELSGGEDWFALYRDSWIKSITTQFLEFIKDRRMTHIKKLYVELFNNFEMEPFDNVQTDENDDGIPVDNIMAISILLTFHKLIFMPEINIVLRPMLIDGEFSRKDNRTEFTESYNVLIKLDDTIKNLTKSLATGGEYGKRWEQINTDVQSIPIRKRKTQILFDEISGTINNILEDTAKSLVSMKNILNGIINVDIEGKYGTLNNLAKISGKGTTFMDGLESAIKKLKSMIKLVDELKSVDDEN